MPHDDKRAAAEANRLYWESDLSVSEVADRLDISRRALYDAIQPAPAGAVCPDCGAHMVYAGRSARASGEAECPECGLEQDIDLEALRRATAEAGAAMRREADRKRADGRRQGRDGMEESAYEEPEAEQERVAGAMSPIDAADALDRDRALLISGAAIAGAALGAVAALLAGRRR